MGSSRKLKLKGQPKKIFSDGGASQGEIGQHEDSFNEDEEMIDELLIELVRLNPNIRSGRYR